EEVVVRDREPPVDLVHPTDRPTAEFAVVAVLAERGDEDLRVVIPLLRAARELAGGGEQLRDRGDCVRPVKRQLERSLRVPRKLERGVEEDDPLRIALRIERLNLPQPAARHEKGGERDSNPRPPGQQPGSLPT